MSRFLIFCILGRGSLQRTSSHLSLSRFLTLENTSQSSSTQSQSLQSLNDKEVTKACSALETKTYVACATYGCTLSPKVSQIRALTVSRHPTCPSPSILQQPTRFRDPQSNPALLSHGQTAITHRWLLQDAASKMTLLLAILGQTRRINWIAMIKSFSRIIFDRIPSAEKSMLERRRRVKHLRKSLRLNRTMPELNCMNHPLHRQHRMLKADIANRRKLFWFIGLFAKALPYIPCLRADFVDDDDASVWSSDPIFSLDVFGNTPPDTMPVVYTSDDLTSIVLPMNDPWDFIHEVKALKRIEEEYHERAIATIQADIKRARQQDEDLHARLQSKLPNRGTSPEKEGTSSALEVLR
ncbi:hypothetical protein IW261DRAFT_1659700 [Armillaria novae-zelandiae]|uniref:Uncharacterized protein n=1 Tax=Armillaria novae-zelandiae TaxID=153914 RepID=A0AA39NWJ5_9AGAR|nr:hypothetical protein IW261DRAFT_1659700 [Armillaria novae-zelandiae]